MAEYRLLSSLLGKFGRSDTILVSSPPKASCSYKFSVSYLISIKSLYVKIFVIVIIDWVDILETHKTLITIVCDRLRLPVSVFWSEIPSRWHSMKKVSWDIYAITVPIYYHRRCYGNCYSIIFLVIHDPPKVIFISISKSEKLMHIILSMQNNRTNIFLPTFTYPPVTQQDAIRLSNPPSCRLAKAGILSVSITFSPEES